MGVVKTFLVASAAIISVPASAAEYIFDININGTSGSGSFVTQGDASTGFTLIQSLTGTFGGSSMTLLAPGTYPIALSDTNDNLFRANSPFFTFNGLSFSANGNNFNIWSNNGSLRACSTLRNSCQQPASFSARAATAAVPEPSVWAMLLLGFFSIGGAMRATRRRQKVTVSYA